MSSTHRSSRGFTLVEMAVAAAIVLVLAALAIASISRQRPRARLSSAAAELHALLHGARLTAMSEGKNAIVMVFPLHANNDEGGTGRVVVYLDGNYDFFVAAAAINFDAYDPTKPAAANRSQVLDTFDLPREVVVGPATGMGAGVTLPAPLGGVDVTKACPFCGDLPDGRGAIVFDARGRTTFYGRNGPAAIAAGSSVSLTSSAPDLQGTRTLVITNTSGVVRALSNG